MFSSIFCHFVRLIIAIKVHFNIFTIFFESLLAFWLLVAGQGSHTISEISLRFWLLLLIWDIQVIIRVFFVLIFLWITAIIIALGVILWIILLWLVILLLWI